MEEGVDDSFLIDLPPASQLDTSVLAALPSSLCQKILEGYAGKEKSSTPKKEKGKEEGNDALFQEERSREVGTFAKPAMHTTKNKLIVANTKRKWKNWKDEIEVGDERIFLSSWKKYVSRLCNSSCGCPAEAEAEGDLERTVDYLSKLARTNLEMTELCLKSFRRFVDLQVCTPAWVSGFNMILQQVQEKIKSCYGGDLKMEPLH